MARAAKLEDQLDALSALRRQPCTDETVRALRAALAARAAPLVARAALIVGELEIESLTTELRAAFHRLLVNPVKSDPGCTAKTEIAHTLVRLGAHEDALYSIGVRHVQREPVWGGTVDTACELRGVCASGLLRIFHPSAANEVAELLADPEPDARAAAARAIAASEDGRFGPLLRFKILAGDAETAVWSECLTALLRVDADGGVERCGRLLASSDAARSETVALALGESRLPGALPVLRDFWEQTGSTALRRTTLLAIALLRSADAHDWLLSVIATAPGHDARDAIAALAVFRDDAALVARVVETATARSDVDLKSALESLRGARQ